MKQFDNNYIHLFIKLLSLILVISLITSITACTIPSVNNKHAGFLGDYDQLQLMPNNYTLFYKDKNINWQKYTSVIVDPVRIFYLSEAAGRALNKEDVMALSNYFHDIMVAAVQEHYTLVDKPGPGVLRIRAAIIDLKPTNVVANVVSKALIYIPVDFGEAAIEGEIIDSYSNKRLVAIVDRKMGNILSLSLGYTRWGHVKDTFDEWGERLSQVIQ